MSNKYLNKKKNKKTTCMIFKLIIFHKISFLINIEYVLLVTQTQTQLFYLFSEQQHAIRISFIYFKFITVVVLVGCILN